MSTALTSETKGALAATLAWFRGVRLLEPITFDPRRIHDAINNISVTEEDEFDDNKVDATYIGYAANPTDENLSSLLTEAQLYGKRILIRGGYNERVDLDDVLQSATVAIFQKLASFKGHSKFRSWCHRIIINTAIDEIRRQDSFPESPLPIDDDGNINNDVLASPNHYVGARRAVPVEHDSNSETEYRGGGGALLLNVYGHLNDWTDDVAEQHFQSETLDEMIPLLPENQRIVVMLTRGGYAPRNIAKLLGEKPKWVSNQLVLAKTALRNLHERPLEQPAKQKSPVKRLSNEKRVLSTAAD